jgi:hypothetical protein
MHFRMHLRAFCCCNFIPEQTPNAQIQKQLWTTKELLPPGNDGVTYCMPAAVRQYYYRMMYNRTLNGLTRDCVSSMRCLLQVSLDATRLIQLYKCLKAECVG